MVWPFKIPFCPFKKHEKIEMVSVSCSKHERSLLTKRSDMLDGHDGRSGRSHHLFISTTTLAIGIRNHCTIYS